jgi:hypothetical protein
MRPCGLLPCPIFLPAIINVSACKAISVPDALRIHFPFTFDHGNCQVWIAIFRTSTPPVNKTLSKKFLASRIEGKKSRLKGSEGGENLPAFWGAF